jgi:Calcineurin-like phosphoesterase
VRKPCKVFGDIHGQFRDLLLLFREFGFPSNKGGDVDSISYVFDGDFVDRGEHQVEVVALLFALKVAFPSRVFLIRGNHEFRDMSTAYGFYGACSTYFGSPNTVFETVHCTFDWLPLAAVISSSVLVVHGGIGAGDYSSTSSLSLVTSNVLFDTNNSKLTQLVPKISQLNPNFTTCSTRIS